MTAELPSLCDSLRSDDQSVEDRRIRMLCSIAFEANRFLEDGLSPRLTAIKLRDQALYALGADWEQGVSILNGDYHKSASRVSLAEVGVTPRV